MASASKLIDLSLAAFGASVAGAAPVPGSGPVAASLGMLGAGLVSMAFRCAARESGAEIPVYPVYMGGRADELDALRDRFGELVDLDAKAYAAVRDAQAEASSSAGEASLAKAWEEALDIPFEIAETAIAGLRLAGVGASQVGAQLATEFSLGVETLATAARGALGIVRANLGSLTAPTLVEEKRALATVIGEQLEELAARIRQEFEGVTA